MNPILKNAWECDDFRTLRHWSWKIGEGLFGLQMHVASPRRFLARVYDPRGDLLGVVPVDWLMGGVVMPTAN